MCTVCGHAGCGRSNGGHAEGHFRDNPDHNFAIDIVTKQVWDYKADRWVCDPLFFPPATEGFASQEEADEAFARQVGGKSLEQMSLNSKLEAIGTEYNYVLVSSLESQKQ
jgi:BRCA1-associated protein